MAQVNADSAPAVPLISRLRLLWPFLALLAAFVFFLEFIADVGGSAEPQPSPPEVAAPTATPTPAPPFPDIQGLPGVAIARVLGGDSILVTLGSETVSVRYYGADAPDAGERCSDVATDANEVLIGGHTLRLLPGPQETDDTGQLLRYVFLEDGRSVDAAMVAQGVAAARRDDGPYDSYFVELETAAREARHGCLWASR